MASTTPSKPEGPTGDFTGDIEVSNKLPSKGDLDRAADMPVVDGSGKVHLFKSLHSSPDSPMRVLIIFIRHFFCGNCQEYLKTLSPLFTPEFLIELEPSTQIVIIGHGQPEVIPFYLKETNCPFPIYADPTKKLYHLLGMTRTLNMGSKAPEYMHDSVVVNAVKSIFQEFRAGRNMLKGGDIYQVGGEFLFENGKVTWCHRMRNTRDHAEVTELRAVLGLDGEGPPMRNNSKTWVSGLGRALSNKRQSWSGSSIESRKKYTAEPKKTIEDMKISSEETSNGSHSKST